MSILSMCTSPLISKYFGNGDCGIHGDYRTGIGAKMRKKKKAQRRAQKQGRKASR